MKFTKGIRSFPADASAVAFPLGGIGTGNVSLGARGELRDWEIFNKPNKGNSLPNTFFTLRTKLPDQSPQTRVIEGPVQPPHTLSHGYHPAFNAGLPRMAQSTLRGEYPIVNIQFEEPSLPVQVELEAYTPLIPLNAEDSGIPCAILTYTLTNSAAVPVEISLVGSITNPVGDLQIDHFSNIKANKIGQSINEYRESDNLRGLYLHADGIDAQSLDYGSVSLVTDHTDTTVKTAWLRGAWYDCLREFWDDVVEDGRLTDLDYNTLPEDHRPDTGSLGLIDSLQPGESKSFRFILSWHFPNRVNSWDTASDKITRNQYATRFDDAWSVAEYVKQELPRLEQQTYAFHDALFGSTMPAEVLDAISANIMPLRSNTCFWLADGRFFGWEGCFDDEGCCAGSCTHVWSYAHTVAYLFPALERTMRNIEFIVETEPTGYMSFRNFQAFDETFVWSWGEQKAEAAVDGQMGSILRAYREWQLSGDKNWLAQIWPGIKAAMNFATTHWDTDGDFVLDGRQHNTYDIEFYGPNPLSSIYYLAALRASEELAHAMGEPTVAKRCHEAFEQGSQHLDELLWNGEYYVQKLDDVDAYKYQHGLGCLSDQLLGQLHARILGLGDLLPKAHVKTAVKAIFDHNFRRNFHDHVNCQRTYVLNDEAGLILCTWPNGGQPRFPFVYSDEVWTGFEYQVAAHLIYEGWTQEGLEIVKAARDRHDGYRRNPWDEVECGHHYARTMSSWALILALSGVEANADHQKLSFNPVLDADQNAEVFETFWSNGLAWGTYKQQKAADGHWQPAIEVLGGNLSGTHITACGQEWVY